MPRSCGSVQNYFRQVDFYPDLRRNQAVLEGMTLASARSGRRGAATAARGDPGGGAHPVPRRGRRPLRRAGRHPDRGAQRGLRGGQRGPEERAPGLHRPRRQPRPALRAGDRGPHRCRDERDHPPEDHDCGVRGRRPDEGRVDGRDRPVGRHALPQHLGLPAQRGRARLRPVPGRPAGDRRRGDPHLGVRPRRQRGRPVRPRAHHDPRGGPLPQPLPHLGRGTGADVHGHRLRRRHPEPVGPELRQARGSRRRRARTCPTATCS